MKNTMKKPVNIPVEKLHPFAGHPFKVKDDDEMNTLIESVQTQGIHKMQTDKLIDCLSLLEQAEQLLIRDLFYNGLTERDAAQKYGVSQVAIHKRKLRILKKLKNMMT